MRSVDDSKVLASVLCLERQSNSDFLAIAVPQRLVTRMLHFYKLETRPAVITGCIKVTVAFWLFLTAFLNFDGNFHTCPC